MLWFDIVSTSPYVAGTMTTQIQMPQTGSATYNGSMMGNVWNNGNTYSATGSYSSTWGFATRAGSFNASFDGQRRRTVRWCRPSPSLTPEGNRNMPR